MDRARIEVAPDGQIVVNVGRLYSWPKGQRDQFERPRSLLVGIKMLRNNNVEFSSGHPVCYGVSIGYTFVGSK